MDAGSAASAGEAAATAASPAGTATANAARPARILRWVITGTPEKDPGGRRTGARTRGRAGSRAWRRLACAVWGCALSAALVARWGRPPRPDRESALRML